MVVVNLVVSAVLCILAAFGIRQIAKDYQLRRRLRASRGVFIVTNGAILNQVIEPALRAKLNVSGGGA